MTRPRTKAFRVQQDVEHQSVSAALWPTFLLISISRGGPALENKPPI